MSPIVARLAVAFQALWLGAAVDRQVSVGGVIVDFIGASGKMQFCPTGSCNENRVRVSMNRLEEVTAAGADAKNAVPSFASQNFAWSAPEEVDVNGKTGVKVTFTSTVKVGSNSPQAPTAKFDMTSYYFNDTTTVDYGNTTLTVPSNSLKFAINVQGWPWKGNSNTNKLQFGVKVETKSPNTDSPSEETSGSSKKVKVPGFEIDLPTMAIADDVAVDANSSMTSGNAVEVNWVFPNFQSTLFYDPVISSSSSSGSDTTTTVSSSQVSSGFSVLDGFIGRSFFGVVAMIGLGSWVA